MVSFGYLRSVNKITDPMFSAKWHSDSCCCLLLLLYAMQWTSVQRIRIYWQEQWTQPVSSVRFLPFFWLRCLLFIYFNLLILCSGMRSMAVDRKTNICMHDYMNEWIQSVCALWCTIFLFSVAGRATLFCCADWRRLQQNQCTSQ